MFQGAGPRAAGAGRSRSAGAAQRRESPAGQSRLCSSLLCCGEPSQGRKRAGCALCLTSSVVSQIEEVPGELMQEDLATDDVMLLDTWDQVGEGQKAKALRARGSGRT